MSAQSPFSNDVKSERLNLRASAYQKKVIMKAASIKHTTITEFVLNSAFEAANTIVANETHLSLSDEDWKAFCDALDTPPKDNPALRKLLEKRSVFGD